ncbi:FG-GAP repeat domain-containing protein [Salegentibacter maritimus]|uniref:FG-GAP repeat domain-containing protein n=1 Tax=Salegentibacter maritimus TaxID=2794347 RepID=UPI0018E494E6|nr:VCBS repeat-containing protein [Salegentibacter maritimus]MBI6115869.1 VCBS repeat-containing protein [Salegentibacter maritimus]
MKKNIFYIAILCLIPTLLSSCKKEQEEIISSSTNEYHDLSSESEGIIFGDEPVCNFSNLKQITGTGLNVTSGTVTEGNNNLLSTSTPVTRAEIDNDRVQSFYSKINFRYNGPSDADIPLTDGTMRRQIGLKLRSKNTCNVLYVMWWLEPYENIAVSIKSNPGMVYHSQCVDGGYTSLYADTSANSFPPVSSMSDGEFHELGAQLIPIADSDPNGSIGDDFQLVVCVDGYEVWRKAIYNLPQDISGASGIRTDNGNFDFTYYSDSNKTDDAWMVSYSGNTPWTQIRVSNSPLSDLAYGDFNGDGSTDIYRTSTDGKAYVSLSGTSDWAEWNSTGYDISTLKFADFNGDNTTDVIRASGGKWYVSLGGSGAWTEWTTSGLSINDFKLGDFNGDGTTDVFTASGGKWYVSLGGNTSWVEWASSPISLSSIKFGDFNGDGITDAFRTSGGKWYVSLATSGTWTEWATSNHEIADMKFADINGDDKTDILIESAGNYKVSYQGATAWDTLAESNNETINSIFTADFNGDGKMDLFKATQQ